MKLLHTGDWHLGKIFYEQSLLEDQRFFLKQITQELQRTADTHSDYDALVVAGDIYDRAFPPAEAVTLLNDFIIQTHLAFPKLHLFFLAGNHDSAPRLAPFSSLLETQNIHFCTDCSTITNPVLVGNGENTAAVYQIPFLTPGSVTTAPKKNFSTGKAQPELFDTPLRSQQELVQEAIEQIAARHKKNYSTLPAVLCAHLFTLNSLPASSERSFVGTAEQVDTALFKPFSYSALGHIHKMQQCGNGRVYYSGSPLAYSFGEGEKYLLSVIVEKKSTEVTKIPIHPLHPVVRLTGSFEDFYSNDTYNEHRDSYVEIECSDSVVTPNPMNLLRKKFPFILSFTRKAAGSAAINSSIAQRRQIISSRGPVNLNEIFDLFMNDVYDGNILDKELAVEEKKLFLELTASDYEEKTATKQEGDVQ